MKTVTEIARQYNVSADTIRHYSKLGLLVPARDSINGYRRYSMQQERRLRFLLSAKRLGFSLIDIGEILNMAASGDTPCPLVKKLIDRHMEVVRAQMRDAQQLMTRMESASREWLNAPDHEPSAESICHLIENWDSDHPDGNHPNDNHPDDNHPNDNHPDDNHDVCTTEAYDAIQY